MAEHPILFTGEMVRAILCGRKTQTRRIIKDIHIDYIEQTNIVHWCPYGKVGDTLWVKEDYKYLIQGNMVLTYYKYSLNDNRVDYTPLNCLPEITRKKLDNAKQGVWKSKLLMFKFMARSWLEITNIRVERVQDITKNDAMAEGIQWGKGAGSNPRVIFSNLWDSINAKRGYGWDKNSWVWVVEFKKG